MGYYQDLLEFDAFICGRSVPQQAQSLLCARLQSKEEQISSRLEYLASKLEIEVSELKKRILQGTVTLENLQDLD
jgi:hypothetical protein